LHLVGILFPHINDDAWSKPHQITILKFDRRNQKNHHKPQTRQVVSGLEFFPVTMSDAKIKILHS